MTNDVRRMIELRSEVRASYYRCRRELHQAGDTRLRALLERSAFVRWRLARSIDAYIASQPAGASRLRPTLLDLAASLALQARDVMAGDRSLPVLRWLAEDTAQLRHSVEICRATTVSLVISDLLGERLEELKPVQRAVEGLIAIATPFAPAPRPRAGRGGPGRVAAT
ncbi:MAG: hypothetical protein MUF07_13315 [Steroidobacteraceae bacterium]|jgi:hypothetical protein|nr:hypothetical protein [Steroidobacteraceae bacterium]